MTPPQELLTIDEAAALLRMSKTTFRRRLDRGEFAVVRDRRVVLVPRDTLLDYLARHTHGPAERVVQRATLSRNRTLSQPRRPRFRRLRDEGSA